MPMFLFPYICYSILDEFTICEASVFTRTLLSRNRYFEGFLRGLLLAMLLVIPFPNENMGEGMHKEWEVVKQMKRPVRFIQRLRRSLKCGTPVMRDMRWKFQ